jgi:hypothetical protein
MLVRADVLIFSLLLLPLVLAGMLTVYFVTHPPATPPQFLALALFVGVPLYWAWIIIRYKLTRARKAYGPDYSHGFLAALVVVGYVIGLGCGLLILKG